jgi:dethiobiotin synthetase
MTPISDEDYVADLAWDLAFPLIVVAPNQLGAINQTLQTLIAAATFRAGIPVAGIVLNDRSPDDGSDPSRATNGQELARRAVPPVLTHLCFQATGFEQSVDWGALAR